MPQFINVLINRFDGGISNDKRVGWQGSGNFFTTNKFGFASHFDIFTYPGKLVPQFQTIANETKAYKIVKFLYCPFDHASLGVYDAYGFLGLGVGTGTNGKIYKNTNPSGSDGVWEDASVGGVELSLRSADVFFYYKDYVYWWAGGSAAGRLMRMSTIINDHAILSFLVKNYDNIAQPVHHPSDDCAYFFCDNLVYRFNDTTWNGVVLTLPTDLKIVCATPYGNYLAIGCTSLNSSNSRAVVYLWDRDSSLATITSIIDFGEGALKHLANLNNKLIGILNFYTDNAFSLDRGKILIKQANGDFASTLNEILADATSEDIMTATRVVKNNRLYFPARTDMNGDPRLGIWVVDEFGRYSLDLIEEEVALDSATPYQGIYLIGNQWWIAHSGDGSVNRSDYASGYSASLESICESLIFNAGDSDISKKLIGAAVMFEKLPATGQVILKYRIDGATSWTTIYTYTTDNGISHEAINIESSGVNLPEFKEIEFRVGSLSGATITGLKFKCEILNKQLF